MRREFFVSALVTVLVGCASQGNIVNEPLQTPDGSEQYSLRAFQEEWARDENALMLAFSGGGTRAAALSYGVLQELRDTRITGPAGEVRLLDEVHSISSVSGGSFTAAYYGLFGDRIFDDYERVFLRQNVQRALIWRVLNPLHWFSSFGRTEFAMDYYSSTVFQGADFRDMSRPGAPLILINATDLGGGLRFSFIQEYFDLLCSDLASFPVARAVTASSAVPVLFNPVVIKKYPGCEDKVRNWIKRARASVQGHPDLLKIVDAIEALADGDERSYLHFVDGGISDNLGLRALYEAVELNGGIENYVKETHRLPPRRLVLIAVDAATDKRPAFDGSPRQPSASEAMGAVTDIQLSRYSNDTLALMEKSLRKWAHELSSPGRVVEPYFILLSFDGIGDAQHRQFFNQIPTSFSLTEEQVDELITAGGELLGRNPEFRRLMTDVVAEYGSRSR